MDHEPGYTWSALNDYTIKRGWRVVVFLFDKHWERSKFSKSLKNDYNLRVSSNKLA